MNRILFLILLLFITPTISGLAQSDYQQQIDDYLLRLENLGYSGSILIFDKGQIVLNEGYGLANAHTGTPNNTDTIYPNGSITKLFTATAILQLHEAGLLDVTAPISNYLDDVPYDKAGITITQLINHTAGLATYHDTDGDFQPMTRDEAYVMILNTPLIEEPGTEYNYSNSGYTLLSILIETISEQSYSDYIRDHIFTQLGMNRSGFQGDTFNNMAYAINSFDGYGVPSDWNYSWVLVGNGGIITTNTDHLLFFQALLNYDLISRETAQYWDSLNQIDIVEDGWVSFAGGGDASAYNASIQIHVAKDIYIFNMTNTTDFPGEFVSSRLSQLIDSEDIPFPPQVTVNAKDTCYSGRYGLDDGSVFAISGNQESGFTITSIGQSALSFINGVTSSELQNHYEQLTMEIEPLFNALASDDFSPLATFFDTPVEVVSEFWSHLESGYGQFVSYELIGTTISESIAQHPVTIVKLEFVDITQYVILYWNADNELTDFTIEGTAPLVNIALYPVEEHIFNAFNIFLNQTVMIHFLINDDDTIAIQVYNGDNRITASNLSQDC